VSGKGKGGKGGVIFAHQILGAEEKKGRGLKKKKGRNMASNFFSAERGFQKEEKKGE